nr:MAG TPA: hypothetical protein [Caudoviricetes sp.]
MFLKWHLFATTLIYDAILGAIKPIIIIFPIYRIYPIYRNFQCIVTILYTWMMIYP